MARALEELYARWHTQRDPASTLALCEALRHDRRPDLLERVGAFVRTELQDNVAALLATARLYLEYARYADAQTLLVSAGKVAPRDAAVYRWLGEVLLRRGDAERAEKVFERAIAFGAADPMTRLWFERATALRGMQATQGTARVADEVLHIAPLPSGNSAPGAAPPPRVAGAKTLPLDEDEQDPTAAHRRNGSSRSQQPPQVMPAPQSMTFGGALAEAAPPELRAPPRAAPPPAPRRTSNPAIPAAAPPFRHASAPPPLPRTKEPPSLSDLQTVEQPRPVVAARTPAPPADLAYAPTSPGPGQPPPLAPNYAAPPAAPNTAPVARTRGQGASARDSGHDGHVPDPRTVLQALALGGIFDTEQVDRPIEWAPPDRPKRFGTKRTLFAMALFAGAAAGIFFYVRHRRELAHHEAEALLDGVAARLQDATPDAFEAMEKDLGRAFELESRSQRAASLWLKERAIRGLVKGGADISFQDATDRGKEVGLTEKDMAFAQVASFLFQGDTAGAAGVMAKWDERAQGDSYYQLLAGATLERAGDLRAADRYLAAAKLEPKLLPARLGYLRVVAMEGDPRKVRELAEPLRAEYPNRAEPQAILALAWARDGGRGDTLPPEVSYVLAHEGEMPLSLLALPGALRATVAFDKRDIAGTRAEVTSTIARCNTPACATWLGILATEIGDEQLSRRAALAALGFSAQYRPARALAARVALLGGRLDEGVKATEDLDPHAPDVAIVRAAAAYEKCDADALTRTLQELPPEAKGSAVLHGFAHAEDVLAGRSLGKADARLALARDGAPWADLIAMDSALDTGDIATAKKIAELWKPEPALPLRALRLSRLARYDGRLEDADRESAFGFSQSGATPRSLSERVWVLAARNKGHDASQLVSKYPLVLGSLTGYLSAYTVVAGTTGPGAPSGNKLEEARGKTTTLTPPPVGAPYPLRLITVVSLAAIKDQKHAGELIGPMVKAGLINPDLQGAAAALNMPKLK
jgi:hypothetical protein